MGIYNFYNQKKGSKVTLKEARESILLLFLDQGLHPKETNSSCISIHETFKHFHVHYLISFSQSLQEAGRAGIPYIFRGKHDA